MSAGDDDLFARWSRRKQAVRRIEAEEAAADAARPRRTPTGSSRSPPAPEPAEPAEPPPSLDDLTADGDLSAFLREGVPAALRNAAMRKMWSLDPAIRDHVGLSEYAWDFNQPGAMTRVRPAGGGQGGRGFPVDGGPRDARRSGGGGPGRGSAGRCARTGGEPAAGPVGPSLRTSPEAPPPATATAGRIRGSGRIRGPLPNAAQATPWRRRAAVGRPFFPRVFLPCEVAITPIGRYYDPYR